MSGPRVPTGVAVRRWPDAGSPRSETLADHVAPPGDFAGPAARDADADCPHALVVEPCKAHANALGLALQRAGFTVAYAASAEEVSDHALRGTAFQLIIAELKLPGQSGLGLLLRVRQACPDTPFFVLAGQPDVASSVCALSLGAAEYLPKPLDETQLVTLCVAAVARCPGRRPPLAPDCAPPSDRVRRGRWRGLGSGIGRGRRRSKGLRRTLVRTRRERHPHSEAQRDGL